MKKSITLIYSIMLVLAFALSNSVAAQPYCNQAQLTSGFASNPVCQIAVCNQDAFCCDNSWDAVCAELAAVLVDCQSCGLFCNVPQGGPGFPSNSDCQAVVCAEDSFCCDTEWDAVCAEAALFYEECASCLGLYGCTDPSASNYVAGAVQDLENCEYIFCDQEQLGSGFAGNSACEAVVCFDDPFCCNTLWDAACAGSASFYSECQSCLTPIVGCMNPLALNYDPTATVDIGCIFPVDLCCYDLVGALCPLSSCANAVCQIDLFCCNSNWDSICASEALSTPACNCPPSGCTSPIATNYDPSAIIDDGSCEYDQYVCCEAIQSGFSCPFSSCEADVCAVDSFCCETTWDGLCANIALFTSSCNCAPGCTDPFASNYDPSAVSDDDSCEYIFCDQSQGEGGKGDSSPGFPQNPACEAAICAADAFCCETTWDSLCASAASVNEACVDCWTIDSCTGLNTFVTIDISGCEQVIIQEDVYEFDGSAIYILENENFCNQITTYNITVYQLPDANVAVDGNILSVPGGATGYQWVDCNNGNAEILGEDSDTFMPQISGSYAVVITNGDCEVTSACVDIVITNINEVFAAGNARIFPNPVTESFFNLELNGLGQANNEVVVQCFDIHGKIVAEQAFGQVGNEFNRTITLNSALATGMYVVNVNVNGKRHATERLIVR